MIEFQSIGPPPEKHADRVVAALMQQLAQKHARLWATLDAILKAGAIYAGSPQAQHRLAARVRAAGAAVHLAPGKRGRFTLGVYSLTGWCPARDAAIAVGDAIPPKPWIAGLVCLVESLGGGRNMVRAYDKPLLFLTHHVISRGAQRLGLRTQDDIAAMAEATLAAALAAKAAGGFKDWGNAPPAGMRLPIAVNALNAVVVLKAHPKRKALIAATVLKAETGERDEHL